MSYLLIAELGDGSLWWKLSTVITCGTLAGAIIPEFVKVFTSTGSAHVREVVTSAREGGASLNIISGLVAGNFSAYYLGMTIMALMAIAYWVSMQGMGSLMLAPAVFAFGFGTALRSNAGTDMIEPYRAPAPSYNYAPPPPPRPVFYVPPPPVRVGVVIGPGYGYYGPRYGFYGSRRFYGRHAYWRGHHHHWH